MIRRNLQARLERTLANMLRFWAGVTRHHAAVVERIARRVESQSADAGPKGEDSASESEVASEDESRMRARPGQPPAHWLERIRDAGPPAQWLRRVQEAGIQEGFERFESPRTSQTHSSGAGEETASASAVPTDPLRESRSQRDEPGPPPQVPPCEDLKPPAQESRAGPSAQSPQHAAGPPLSSSPLPRDAERSSDQVSRRFQQRQEKRSAASHVMRLRKRKDTMEESRMLNKPALTTLDVDLRDVRGSQPNFALRGESGQQPGAASREATGSEPKSHAAVGKRRRAGFFTAGDAARELQGADMPLPPPPDRAGPTSRQEEDSALSREMMGLQGRRHVDGQHSSPPLPHPSAEHTARLYVNRRTTAVPPTATGPVSRNREPIPQPWPELEVAPETESHRAAERLEKALRAWRRTRRLDREQRGDPWSE